MTPNGRKKIVDFYSIMCHNVFSTVNKLFIIVKTKAGVNR